ncbi:MAG: FAD-dependent monooxygenase [Janthinobacterium lividum]
MAPGQSPELGRTDLQAILERRTGRSDLVLQEPGWVSLWRGDVRIVDRYRQGRVFLAGDAAHIHSPAGGRGMNTGIQDAHNLGWKLAAVVNGDDQGLLDTYEAERRPVAVGVLALADARLAQTIQHNDIVTRRDGDTTQLSVSCRGSVLAHDDRDDTAAVRAGDRAPDATGPVTAAGERRLFDLTRGGRFTLLRFGSGTKAHHVPEHLRTLDVVEQLTGPGDVVDTYAHLTRAYAATSRTLVLIRPDGYIGLISDDGDLAAVLVYLAAMTPWRDPVRA